MKQKIYQLSQIFFAFLLLLLATNCSQDNFSEIESVQSKDEIQSLEQSPYVLDVVRLEDVPILNDIIFGSSNRGSKFQSVEGQPNNEECHNKC